MTNNNRLIGTSVDHSSDKFDAVLISDMTRGGDIGLRIRREVQALTRSGYRCAFRHLPPGSRQTISPDIQRCVREGLALPVPAGTPVAAKLAIAYSPGTLNAPVDLDGLSAEQVVLVVDSPPSPKQMGYWFGFGFGPMTWAPTNRWVRARLEGPRLSRPSPRRRLARDSCALPAATGIRPGPYRAGPWSRKYRERRAVAGDRRDAGHDLSGRRRVRYLDAWQSARRSAQGKWRSVRVDHPRPGRDVR